MFISTASRKCQNTEQLYTVFTTGNKEDRIVSVNSRKHQTRLCSSFAFIDFEYIRVIRNDCRGFNNLSYTIHLIQQYVVAPMDQEILSFFFYDVRRAVVMHFSAWSAVH